MKKKSRNNGNNSLNNGNLAEELEPIVGEVEIVQEKLFIEQDTFEAKIVARDYFGGTVSVVGLKEGEKAVLFYKEFEDEIENNGKYVLKPNNHLVNFVGIKPQVKKEEEQENGTN